MFSSMQFLLSGVLKLEQTLDHDVIPIFCPRPSLFFSFLEDFEGSGAPPGSSRRSAPRANC